jgi:putative copper export protein/methionine-rich copper-binding protein CopC
MSLPIPGHVRRRPLVALLLALALLVPAAAHAHVRLDASSPGRDEVLSVMPSHMRLLFSGTIEARYTSVTLTAPDGQRVAIGDVVFVDGSDREFTLTLPALDQPGTWTVRWRTAGADGHVLQGSYTFVLAPDTSASPVSDTAGAAGASDGADPSSTMHAVDPGGDSHAHHDEPQAVGGARDAIGRGLHFVALLLMLGGMTFRGLIIPRLDMTPETTNRLKRRAWRVVSVSALLLAAAAVLRLWLQSSTLHGAERAWNTSLLSIMLTDTGWGRAWMLQAVLFALLGMAIAWARPGRDRVALIIGTVAVAGLATIPALTGHAAGAEGFGRLIILSDAVHVIAAGAWLGTLALLMFVAIPSLRRHEPNGDTVSAEAIETFSPIALTAAAIVVLSGVINSAMHLSAPSQLWTTVYGRTLLVKLLLVACVALAGLVNWRLVRPRLREIGGIRRLRVSAAAELGFAALVLVATAVLTGQPRP